jgi:D-3-phosphoglycerate dehydrogenase / 2-oxoglutarate reductase
LQGEFVPDAVNVQAGGVVAEEIRPGLPLAEKLGRVFTALAGGVASRLNIEVRGEIAAYDVSVLQLSALKGVFADVVEEPVTFVNAPLHAAERGVELDLVTNEESPDYRNLVTLQGTLATGEQVSVSGTLSGPRHIEKLTEIDGFDVDVQPIAHMAFFRYDDRPGVVGIVGRVLGEAGVNIASMQVSRREAGGEALMVLTVDSAIPADALADIAKNVGASSARTADLTEQ